ncbi:hypothetical protein GCM10009603_36240 [Nocardiopsis exhalans]
MAHNQHWEILGCVAHHILLGPGVVSGALGEHGSEQAEWFLRPSGLARAVEGCFDVGGGLQFRWDRLTAPS